MEARLGVLKSYMDGATLRQDDGAAPVLPRVRQSDPEAVTQSVHGGSADVSGVAEAGRRALAKIDLVLPTRLRKRLEALRTAIVRLPAAAPREAIP